jgi:large subunit ribosomal protein L15
MKLNELEKPQGSTTSRKRVGRGPGSGLGEQSTRGGKGARARSGFKYKAWHEGGQMPLVRRLPKRGFKNHMRVEYQVVNVCDIDRKFAAGSEVTLETLRASKLIKTLNMRVKVLGNGELKKNLTIKVHAASQSAIDKVTAAGGKVEIVK